MFSQRNNFGVGFYAVLFIISGYVYKNIILKGKNVVKENRQIETSKSIKKTDSKEKELFFSNEEIIVYDLETTGVNSYEDEILQLAVINGNGEVLFNSYFKPEHRKRWPKAQEVNHITWQMVKDKPFIQDKVEEILKIFNNAKLIVGYNNKGFDNNFLETVDHRFYQIYKSKIQYDVMLKYAEYKGVWDSYHGDWKWFRLDQAARHFKYQPQGELHDALEDCRATLWVLQHMETPTTKEVKDSEVLSK